MPVRERYETGAADSGEQRPCARGQWCASRTVAIDGSERVVTPALGYRAFCDRDEELIGSCVSEMPAIYGRLQAEIGKPAATDTSIRVPFGPSVPLRLDIDAAMRATAFMLAFWASRVITTARSSRKRAARPLTPGGVASAAEALEANLGVLLALQPGWMTHNVPMPAGRSARGGTEATCRRCGRHISLSTATGKWWGAYRASTDGMAACQHDPRPETVIRPSAVLIPAGEDMEDAEIVRMGADFAGLFIRRDGAAAGLEILHLHYWDRAVLRETPARPEELLGVECRGCSLLALRRAAPPWHKGDPEFFSECAECGHLMTEDEYRHWVSQLHAYHKARVAAMPVLAASDTGCVLSNGDDFV